MSFAAVYQVTRALRMLLRSQLTTAVASAVVTLHPPGDDLPKTPGVNLYLYRVTESPATRNRDWPGDRNTPPSDRPALGLQLDYLLTPLGSSPDDNAFGDGDDAHTMLGLAMLTLSENPVLNDVHIPGFDADTVLPAFLQDSFEQVKVSLLPVGLEELSKIWATINQPYRLSVAYGVSLVELSPTAPPPVRGGVVQTTGLEVVTLDPPRLVQLTPTSGPLARMVSGAVTPNHLVIGGFGFAVGGQAPTVRVGGRPVAVDSSPAPAETSLSVTLPVDLDAGPDVDVTVTLTGRTGAPLTFRIEPWLSSLTPIRTSLDPAHVPDEMRLTLQGEGFAAAPQTVRFASDAATDTATTDPGGTTTSATASVPTSLPNGVYQVRVQLPGGAASLSNSRSLEVIPQVATPIAVAVVSVGGRNVHRLTFSGSRLAGTDRRLEIDDRTYAADVGGPPGQIGCTLGRQLLPGPHIVVANVDGHRSRPVELVI